MIFEIQIPARNPTAVLEQTVRSLTQQTVRNFRVLLSDNLSTSGGELIDAALKTLGEAGIECRKVIPPPGLGRVEHWNWIHSQPGPDWVKPLFVGDWLEPGAVQSFTENIARFPEARFAYAGFAHHTSRKVTVVAPPGPVRFRSRDEMGDAVLRWGHQFGPPSAYAFERTAFLAMGGYRPTLPICADSLLCCTLATREGALLIPETLANFNLHGARFSTDLDQKHRATFREKMIYSAMLAYHAWTESRRVPSIGFSRLLLREFRSYAEA